MTMTLLKYSSHQIYKLNKVRYCTVTCTLSSKIKLSMFSTCDLHSVNNMKLTDIIAQFTIAQMILHSRREG